MNLVVECFGYDFIGMRMYLVLLVVTQAENDHYTCVYDHFIKAVIIIGLMQFLAQ